ncbi:MAG: arginine--tRNA ligase [Planctomycetota bacterium]
MTHDSLYNLLTAHFAAAVSEVAGATAGGIDAAVRPAGDPRFGDYQCNAAMPLAKVLKTKPRDVAQRIVAAVQPRLADLAEPLDIAGPGFINIRLKADFLARYLGDIPAPPPVESTGPWPVPHEPAQPAPQARAPAMDRVGLPPVEQPRRVVVEYSQPNIAKQMHVGHLRSTIIGDVFARVLSFEGHEVIRQNHIGDWGTQFGMLIRWYREHPLPTAQTHDDVLDAIERDYRAAQERFEADAIFADEARRAVTALQGGDADANQLWRRICQLSLDAIDETYRRLGVLLRPEDVRGESFYNDRLAGIIAELRQTLAGDATPLGRASDPPPFPGGGGGGSGSSATRAQNPPVVPPERGDGSALPVVPPDRGDGRWPRAEVRDDQGAVCVFLYDEHGQPLFKNPEGDILPMIIRKSDGAYLYATTDLAAIRYRLKEMVFPSGVGAQRVIYVTDARQKLHFQMFLATARAAGWITPEVSVEHVTFGSVLGADRKPLKTRSGGTIKLRDLLDEAEQRAYALLTEREQDAAAGPGAGPSVAAGLRTGRPAPDRDQESAGASPADRDESAAPLSEEEKRHIARRIGIAAVKYADLRNDRNGDYVFDWDKMISFQGNTAPYMMYAYARIRSIYRKAAERIGTPNVYAPDVRIRVGEPTERALALRLARLREEIDKVAADLLPHTLCAYLYELAGDFMRFYENCPVLAAPDDATRLSRLRLCDLTARTLKLGLGLLGIEVIERM